MKNKLFLSGVLSSICFSQLAFSNSFSVTCNENDGIKLVNTFDKVHLEVVDWKVVKVLDERDKTTIDLVLICNNSSDNTVRCVHVNESKEGELDFDWKLKTTTIFTKETDNTMSLKILNTVYTSDGKELSSAIFTDVFNTFGAEFYPEFTFTCVVD